MGYPWFLSIKYRPLSLVPSRILLIAEELLAGERNAIPVGCVPRLGTGSSHRLPKLLSREASSFSSCFSTRMDTPFTKLIWCCNEPFPRTQELAGWNSSWIIINGDITDIHGAEHPSRPARKCFRDDHSTVSNIFATVKGLDWLKELDGHYNDL